jgi:2-oxo-3-hexenedioate decarboxylase
VEEAVGTAIAREALAALATGRQIAPFSRRYPGFDLAGAYRVTDAVRRLREALGERRLGRKIGFTNPGIWDEYQVHAPIWGFVYDSTVRDLTGEACELANLAEPRIEPEIAFGLGTAPAPDMDEAALLDCVEWVAHGFEIVQSVFPRWEFTAPDTIAAYGLHGRLFIGPRCAMGSDRAAWLAGLPSFEIELFRNGAPHDRGRGSNVLGGPLSALKHVVRLLAEDPDNPPLAAGETVTTGTLTRAFPVAPGEIWTTRLSGIDLPGARLVFV